MKELCERVVREVGKVVVGHDHIVRLVFCALSVGGHVLLQGPPGVAKTLMANALSKTLVVRFRRIQLTTDMHPGDLIGTFGETQLGTVFQPGPVFTNVLLADEINRTPPQTQSGLLEAMQERQVTVAGETHRLPEPFCVIATEDPSEEYGTYPLPEAQLDRFLFMARVGYPSEDEEIAILHLNHHGVESPGLDVVEATAAVGDLMAARELVDRTKASRDMVAYVARIVRATRTLPRVARGASPRASVHLLAAAKAMARIEGRDHVVPEDVCNAAPPALRHRLLLRPGHPGYTTDDALMEVLGTVPVP